MIGTRRIFVLALVLAALAGSAAGSLKEILVAEGARVTDGDTLVVVG